MTAELHLDEVEAELRRQRIARFDANALLWLAALPEWTDRRARAVGFPSIGTLPELLDRLHAAGLLARRSDVAADGELVTAFWLPASRRAEVGVHLRATLSPNALQAGLRTLAEKLQRLPRAEVGPWLMTVRHLDDPSGVGLLTHVDQLVRDGRADAALGAVAAAQALGDVLGEPLVSAARRAQWRIDRGHRQALDARTVASYLPHPQVEAVLRELVGGDGPAWAVHLLGDGGVGKTMAVRDLASGRFAARSGHPQPIVARVDFDHLDPRYPYGRPAELLLALVGELFTYSSTRESESAFRASDDALSYLHEMVGATPEGPDPRLVDDAVDAFAEYLNGLDDTVVLVMDTCEELAKLHPPGGRAPAVDHTFALLERVHARAPRMRAVLAGRRWLVPPPDGSASGGLVLEPRPYLTVVPVTGFDSAQASAYLDRRGLRGDALRAAVLARCTLSYRRDVNPYDLACYCDWALAEPDLDPDALRDAPGDPYVEQRILARLPDAEVRDCLPVAVELGRFDRSMIGPALRRRGIDVDAAFSGLVGQEWVSAVTFNRDGRPDVVEIDPQLRPRLQAVLAGRPDRYPRDVDALAADLRALVETVPLPELPVEAVEAALRLLPVADGGMMWARLEERVAESGLWDWALQAVPRAAAVEQTRAAGAGLTIQAAVLATQAAAQLRFAGGALAGPLWWQVGELAGRHPDDALQRTLRFRGLCGVLAAGMGRRDTAEELAERWADDGGTLPLDSLLAALHANLPDDLHDALPVPEVPSSPPAIVSAIHLAAADYSLRRGDPDEALDSATRAASAAWEVGDDSAVDLWPDYLPPACPVERARLGVLLAGLGRRDPPDQLPLRQWREDALPHVADIDAERLIAATLAVELAWRPVPTDTVRRAMVADAYAPQRVPSHRWHHLVPPLCLAVARCLAAVGDASGAGEWLRRRREEAVSAGDDAATIHLCERELADLSRVFRSLAFSTAVPRMVERVDAAGDAAWVALALLRGECPPTPARNTTRHAWWRTQRPRRGLASEAAIVFSQHGDLGDLLDEVEAALVHNIAPADARATASAKLERAVRPIRPALGDASVLADLLRAEALLDPPPAVDALLDGLPPRLVGEAAMAEGELLALRLPGAALTLVDRAVRAFRAAGDEAAASRAAILRVLTAARAGSDRAALDPHGWSESALQDDARWSGWSARAAQARRLLAGLPPNADDPSPELRAAEPDVGHFGHYELREQLNSGIGERWRAYDPLRGRVVDLEILPATASADNASRSRFEQDLRIARSIDAPHLQAIYDIGELDDRLYVALRPINGDGLDRLVTRDGPLRPERAAEIVGGVAAALTAVHAAGLLHGDIRPGRVLVATSGYPYLTGLGVSRPRAPAATLTSAGSDVRGRLAYAAPEQLLGSGVDVRTDVYALTCVLYELLTGSPPFTGEAAAVVYGHLHAPRPRPSAVRPELPVALDKVVARGMAKDPAQRFASADVLAAAVRATLEPWVVKAPVPPPVGPYPVGSAGPTVRQTVVRPGPSDTSQDRASPRRGLRWTLLLVVAAGVALFVGAGIWLGTRTASSPVFPDVPTTTANVAPTPTPRPTGGQRPSMINGPIIGPASRPPTTPTSGPTIGPRTTPISAPTDGTAGSALPSVLVVLVVLVLSVAAGAGSAYVRRRRHAADARDVAPDPGPTYPGSGPDSPGSEKIRTEVTVAGDVSGQLAVGTDVVQMRVDRVLGDVVTILPGSGPSGPPPSRSPALHGLRREGPAVVLVGRQAGPQVLLVADADEVGTDTPPSVLVLVGPRPAGPPLRWRLPAAVAEAPGQGRLVFRGPSLMRPTRVTVVAAGPRACTHVVGTAVETRAGWRIRIRDATRPTKAVSSRPSKSDASSYEDHGHAQQARGQFAGEELLGPDDVGATATPLVVLQAETALSARAADRSRDGMRAVAAELVTGRLVGAVLVVPSVADTRAQAAVDTVAGAVDRWDHPPHPLDLLEVAARVQDQVGARVLVYANTEGTA